MSRCLCRRLTATRNTRSKGKWKSKKWSLATKKLTAAQQEVISLRFAGELSIAEVAGVMGKSEGAVKALQHSAIVALRKVLSPEVA